MLGRNEVRPLKVLREMTVGTPHIYGGVNQDSARLRKSLKILSAGFKPRQSQLHQPDS